MSTKLEPTAVAVTMWALCDVLFVAQICGFYQFMSRRHLWIIKKRYPKIVQTETLVVIFALLVAGPLLSIEQMQIDENQDLEHWIHFFSIICRPSFCFVAYLEAARLWLIFYDLNILKSAQNEEWGSQLTSKFSKTDFYLMHRTKLGDARWVIPRMLSVWFLVTVCTVTTDLVEFEWSSKHCVTFQRSLHGLYHALPLVGSAIIYLKSSKVPRGWFDGLMLQYEFRGTIILVAVTAVGYGSAILLNILGFIGDEETWCVIVFTLLLTISMPSLLSTLWIPLQIGKSGQWDGVMNIKQIDWTRGVFSDHQKSRSLRSELMETFQSAQKLDTLMHWMTQEFCIECMLCLIEMAQFKQHLIEHIERSNPLFAEQNAIRNRFRFHEQIPLSSIVFSDDDLAAISAPTLTADTRIEIEPPPTAKVAASSLLAAHIGDHSAAQSPGDGTHGAEATPSALDEAQMKVFRAKTRRLYRKYIDSGSPMEINIAGALRARFYHFDRTNYAALNELDLVRFFDDVVLEMMLMVQQSFSRLIGHSMAADSESAAR